jgi:ketosteroid isomerase-like protein
MTHHDAKAADGANRATLDRLFKAFESSDWDEATADFAEDFVQEWPQSGERLMSKAACLAVYRGYPGGPPTIHPVRVSGEGDHWTVEADMQYGAQPVRGVFMFEFRDGRIVRETDYFADPFEPPAWRSQWVSVG